MNLVTALSCLLLAPQGTESSGPFVGVPHTISVSTGTTGGTVAMSNAQVWFKQPGVTGAPPIAWTPTAGRPDFRITSILSGLTTLPDIASFSIGLDWILADLNGKVFIPTGGWGVISMSFTPGSVGANGTLVNSQSTGDGLPADLYSYIPPGSVAPPAWVDVLIRAQNSGEINIGGSKANIDGHDLYVAAYALDPAIVALLPTRPTFYFTVTKATLSTIPTAWWGSTTPSGATILSTTWNDTTSTWSTPTVFLAYSAFGFASGEEIDALAVDPIRVRLLLSTKTKTRDAILVVVPGTPTLKVMTYRLNNASGTPVSARIGLLTTDDVDAICAFDPGRGPGGRVMPAVIGQPLPQRLLPNAPGHGSVSAYRVFNRGLRIDEIHSVLNGWPQNGRPAPSIAIVALTFPGFPGAPLQVIGQFLRNPVPNGFPGGPTHLRIQIPQVWTLNGLRIAVHWITGDRLNPNFFTLPHPTEIRL